MLPRSPSALSPADLAVRCSQVPWAAEVPLTHSETRIKTPLRWEKSGPCSVFHSVPCHVFLSARLSRVLTELSGHRSQILWMLFITLLWWEWFGFIFQCASSTEIQSVLLVQTDFDLFSVYKWPPALASPLRSLATSVIHSMYVWSGKHDFHCLKLQSPALLPTPHCSFWPSGWLGRQLLDLSWAVPTHTLFLLIEKNSSLVIPGTGQRGGFLAQDEGGCTCVRAYSVVSNSLWPQGL